METFIYLVLLFYFVVVGIICERPKLKSKRDYSYESESEDIDSVSVESSVSVENNQYDDLLVLPIGALNTNRKKASTNYVNNWQYTPPREEAPVKEKILIEVTPKAPTSYRVKQKAKPFSARHTTRRTTEAPLPENFQPQWVQDNSYYDKLFLKPATATTVKTTTTTTTTETPFPWGHSSYEYEGTVHKNSNYKPRPVAESQEQLNKLFGSPPTFDWGTLRPTVDLKQTSPRPSRRPGYLQSPIPTVGISSAEKETVKIKWKPKYTTVPFDFANATAAPSRPPPRAHPTSRPPPRTHPTTRAPPRTHPTTRATTTTPRPRVVTTESYDIEPTPTKPSTEVPVLFSLFNVTNLVGGAAEVSNLVNGVSNVSGTNDNPITWVTSSVEQEHHHYEYPDDQSQEAPLIQELIAANNSSEELELSGNPIRNTETGAPTPRPALPSRIRNTIDDLKQQLVVFVEELWDRTLYGSGGGGGGSRLGNGSFPGGGGGGKGGFGGKGGGKGGFGGKGGKGGGSGGGNTWVGPYRSVLFQFNRFELNLHNGSVGLDGGVIPEPVKQRFTGNQGFQNGQQNRQQNWQQNRQQNRQHFTRKAHPPVPSMFSITDY